eukprot:s2423_g20.t4
MLSRTVFSEVQAAESFLSQVQPAESGQAFGYAAKSLYRPLTDRQSQAWDSVAFFGNISVGYFVGELGMLVSASWTWYRLFCLSLCPMLADHYHCAIWRCCPCMNSMQLHTIGLTCTEW